MTGDLNSWDVAYHRDENLWAEEGLEPILSQYLSLLPEGACLDAGCGQGRASFALARQGYSVTGIDHSAVAVERCRQQALNTHLSIDFQHCDLSDFDYLPDSYNLVMANWVLSFIPREKLEQTLEKMISSLSTGGLFYGSFFSRHDPGFQRKDDPSVNYFRFDEVLKLFPSLKIIHAGDVIGLDLSHGQPHYHGVIQYIGQKVTA